MRRKSGQASAMSLLGIGGTAVKSSGHRWQRNQRWRGGQGVGRALAPGWPTFLVASRRRLVRALCPGGAESRTIALALGTIGTVAGGSVHPVPSMQDRMERVVSW